MNDMSTVVATLNAKLAEQAQGSDVASLKTEIEGARKERESLKEELDILKEGARTERESLNEVLDILKAEVSLLKEGKDPEESTATNSPKRVQPSRRSKSHRMSSLETQSRGSQMDSATESPRDRNKSDYNSRSSLEAISDGGGDESTRKKAAEAKKKGTTIKASLRVELEALMNTNDIPDVSLDDIIGQEKAKSALLELKPFRDPKTACFYADVEDDSNSNTGILLYGPAGTVSSDAIQHTLLLPI